MSVRTALLAAALGDRYRGARVGGAPPALTGSLGRAAGVSAHELVEPRHQPRAARSELGGLHQFHQRPHRRRTPPRRAALHPDFGPSPYGIPYVVVSGDQPLVRPVVDRLRRRERRGRAGPARSATRSRPKRRRRPATSKGRCPAAGTNGDRHLLIVDSDNWLLYETGATYWNAAANRWEANCGAIFDLNTQRPAPRDMDVGRRRGPRDLSGPGALRRSVRRRGDHARVPRDRAIDQRLRVARVASRRVDQRRAADGRPAADEGVEEPVGLLARDPAHLPRDAALRPDRRRQRLRHVRHGDDGCAVGQRGAEPRLPRPARPTTSKSCSSAGEATRRRSPANLRIVR